VNSATGIFSPFSSREREVRPDPHRPRSKAAIIARRPLAVAALAALTTCGPAGNAADPYAVADALGSTRIGPRLSISTRFQSCPDTRAAGGTILRARCPAPPATTAARLAEVAVRARQAGDDPAALHALALVDLAADDSTDRALERAIAGLRQVALAERPAQALADLSAALIVRAERIQAPRDLLEAYETAEQALRHDPRNAAALYNRALSLDRFGLVDEAARDWQAYLAADSTSGWADDARRRRGAVLAIRAPAAPAANAPLSAYAAYAVAEPQGARELGMDSLLPEWGAAVAAGDATRAADRLDRAAALGQALERRPGGDASLADMVRAIRAAASDAAATRMHATAHREFGAARREFGAYEFTRAEALFAAVARAPGASPALRGWASMYLGTARVPLRKLQEGQQLLAQAAASDSMRYPALVARARWPLGVLLGRGERWERALAELSASANGFARAGERENEAAALGSVADARFVLGEPDSGYAAVHRGMVGLKPYRGSLRLHTLLVTAATKADADGLLGAAIRLQSEDLAVTRRTGNLIAALEARFERARYLAIRGDTARARADLDTARAGLAQVDYDVARGWLQGHLYEAEAVVTREGPDRVTAVLDSAAAVFGARSLPFRVLPALIAGAEVRLADNDAPGAVQRLEAAVRLLDLRRDSIRIEPRRAAVFDAARSVIDRIVLLKLADGRTAEALDYMDRGRASLAAAGRTAGEGNAAPRGPRGEVVVEYARIADTLLAWTVAGSDIVVSRTVVDTLRLVRTVRELEGRLQDGAPEAEVQPALALLYDWLIRPVERTLGPAETPLVVVADGEIAAVPFAALYDARRRRYLVQDRPLRFAVSLREARREPVARPAGAALLVADPAFDRREHRLLQPLAHARQEVRAIAAGYATATVLEGADATWPGVERALAGAGVVHFAGHAVFDDQRPERSYLVLARGAEPASAGRLTAAELSRLDLRHVRLVVLSACRTVRSGPSRAGGFTGLSGALLAAGAGAAVGSTWEVDDRFAGALMTRFHAGYQRRGDGPRALRDAQLALLQSTDPALRTPAAWAGFRYAGR
jgi:CHAT domain-containing protein